MHARRGVAGSLTYSVVGRLTRSRVLARRLFGVALPPLEEGEHYFDVTTLALRRLLRQHVPRGARVLDMGTGSAAILGIWLWRELGCTVTSTELDPHLARRARESVRANGAPISILEARFFDGVDERFDHVVFNPPYVPTSVGRARRLPERTRSQWDGGPEGVSTVESFLRAFEAEGGEARAWLGVNRRHVPRAVVEQLCARRQGLVLRAVHARRWLPVDVYVLERTQSPIASTSSPDE